jgi:predicted cupin superfamily sugar epimerase
MTSADELIEQLQLEKHPEGGWYRETWRGPENEDGRAIGTAILFLLKAGEASHWHRVDAHEMWIWQHGDPLDLQIADSDDDTPRSCILGEDVAKGHALQGMVPPHAWQAARCAETVMGYTLVSCTVTPGFRFEGFELAAPDWQPGA